MKIVTLGDSLTYGYGVPKNDSWVCMAQKKLGFELVNKGITGDTTSGFLSRFRTDVIDENPNGVFIMGGGNDISAMHSISSAKVNLWSLVYQARGANIEPVLGVPIQGRLLQQDWAVVGDYSRRIRDFEELRKWIFGFGGAMKIPIIDFGGYYKIMEDQYTLQKLYLSDGIHPSKFGHELLSEYFCREINYLLHSGGTI
jgi:acyl-CoA thioesterase I